MNFLKLLNQLVPIVTKLCVNQQPQKDNTIIVKCKPDSGKVC